MPESVCLCTYTYNDAELVLDLLRSLASWTRRPNDILIVDDGSAKPFPDARVERVRVLRIPINSGPAQAKALGLSSVRGDIILSVDCDIRLDPEWLERCLALAREPEVGIVGSPVLNRPGKGLVAEYLAEYDNHEPRHGKVDFLTGGLWLMRREVWERAGGFGELPGRTHEDHAFCQRVRGLGLDLICDAHRPAHQVRRLSRTALSKRMWHWISPIYHELAEKSAGIEVPCGVLLEDGLGRMSQSLSKGRPMLVYMDMLLLCHGFLSLCALAEERRAAWKYAGPGAAGLRLALERFLDGFSRLKAILLEDLFRLGHRQALTAAAQEPDMWTELLRALRPLIKAGALSFLDVQAVRALLEEDRDTSRHFSFYEEI